MVFSAAPNIALQSYIPGIGTLMLALSVLGLPEFYLVIIPLILWCYDKTLGIRLIILLSISAALNTTLKILFHSPRPYWIDSGVKGLSSETTFGMPSGAAQISLSFLGYIGAWFRKTGLWIAVIILVLLVGIARMYLGVHYLEDVLAGFAIALVILLVFLRYETRAAAWLSKKSDVFRIVLAFLASCVLIVLTGLVIMSLGSWQVPVAWSDLAFFQTGVAIAPVSLRDSLLAAGLLFGAGSGYVISSKYFPYSVEGTRTDKLFRYVIGIAVLGLLWFILNVPAKSPGIFGYFAMYCRAMLAGIWITAGAPFVFGKLGLVHDRYTRGG